MENVARALVDAPDQVAVSVVQGEGGIVLELRAGPGDFGKVIGRQGRTARSLRTIVAAAAEKQHSRCTLEILE